MKNIKKMSNLLKDNNASETSLRIPLNQIVADPNQPRKQFDDNALKELADSIMLYGVMQPITVASIGDDKYIIRIGERRYRASLLAGMKDIPAIIDNNDNNILEKQLIENIARENLSVAEIAESIRYLIDINKMKKKDLATALGKSNAFVSNYYGFAVFQHPLKEKILEKTQDLIIIADFKRILEKASDDIEGAAEHFLSSKSSVNRDDMELFKAKIDKVHYQQDEEQSLIDSLAAHTDIVKDEPSKHNNDDSPTLTKATASVNDDNNTVIVELSKVIDFLKEILPSDISKSTIKKIKKEFGS